MTNENGRTVRLLGIAIAILALILITVCVVGGYFVSNQLTADTRPCKEQVSEFQDDLYVVVTLAVITYRQSLDAVNEGRFEDAILLQEIATSATKLATNSLERMLGEQ